MNVSARLVPALLIALVAPSALADARLAQAVRADDVDAAREALATGSDPDAGSDVMTPLTVAAVRGNAEMLELLLAAGADPDEPNLLGVDTLAAAILSCAADQEIVRMLIDAGADLESGTRAGTTPTMLAFQERRVGMARLLLDAGADVNAINRFGDGLLNYAIYMQEPALIAAVMDRGIRTEQLRKLFTTVDYDPPGFGGARSHHAVLCR